MITVAAHADDGAATSVSPESDRERLQCAGTPRRRARRGGEEGVGVEAHELGAQAGEEPEQGERRAGQQRRRRVPVLGPRIRAGNASAT